jgi:hypothetical protein
MIYKKILKTIRVFTKSTDLVLRTKNKLKISWDSIFNIIINWSIILEFIPSEKCFIWSIKEVVAYLHEASSVF